MLERRRVYSHPAEKRADPLEEFKKTAPKCQGCPYGDRQHCVGICWKDVYAPYKKKKTITITETTEITEVMGN